MVRVALGRGEVAAALAVAEEILVYLAEHQADRTDEHLRIYLACYRALAAAGDPRASGLLDTAHGLLQARAQTIQDPTLRMAFLNDVAVHRGILRLMETTLERESG